MRQVGDTLVWLGLISVATAVVYFTPRFANYVTASEADSTQLNISVRPAIRDHQPIASHHVFHKLDGVPN